MTIPRRTGDPLYDAYLYAGGDEGPFPSRCDVLLQCEWHGLALGGLYDTELGPLVALGDSFHGTTPERLVRKLKLPAGWKLDLRLLDELTDDDALGVWCHKGGRIELDASTLRTAWANRASRHTWKLRH